MQKAATLHTGKAAANFSDEINKNQAIPPISDAFLSKRLIISL